MATQSSSSLFLRISPDFTSPRSSFSSPPTSPTGVSFRRDTRSFSSSYASAETARSPSYLDSKTGASFPSLYEVLGIPMGASCHEIKAAYRKLARVCHPDVVAIQGKDNSSDEFIKIHAAYSTLSDPEKRSDYDRKLFKRRVGSQNSTYARYASPSGQSTGFSGPTRRNWETDQCW